LRRRVYSFWEIKTKRSHRKFRLRCIPPHGVVIAGAIPSVAGRVGVLIQGNYIGTDAGGAAALANLADGIFVGSQSVQCKIEGNLIAFNGSSSVNIPDPPSQSPGQRITVATNAIVTGSPSLRAAAAKAMAPCITQLRPMADRWRAWLT
jgi:hypothetical protein